MVHFRVSSLDWRYCLAERAWARRKQAQAGLRRRFDAFGAPVSAFALTLVPLLPRARAPALTLALNGPAAVSAMRCRATVRSASIRASPTGDGCVSERRIRPTGSPVPANGNG